MSRHSRAIVLHGLLLGVLLFAARVHAEPYLAVQMGLQCGQCHVNPTGGGERTVYGEIFAQTLLPATHIDTGGDQWTGEVAKFLSVGGDLRFQASYTKVPGTTSTNQFDLEQARVYLSANVIPQRLLVYVDEQVAPGGALNREAYGMYWSANHDWYLKAGQMYLPFGLRLQDTSAFVQQITGINMTTPDKGVEFGWERGLWDAQLAVSNGTAGGAVTSHGKQVSGQLIYVQSMWRVGVAANYNDASSSGSKSAAGVFAGLRTGPVAWLAQVDATHDNSVTNQLVPPGPLKQVASLLEANWLIVKGNNLKLTAEFLDPNKDVHNNGQTRWSIVYELSPIQFVQLRAGFRYNDGIPQAPSQHQKLAFLELHGFF
jgi:hypothetical protein